MPDVMTPHPFDIPFEKRAEELLCKAFGGMHHVYSLKKTDRFWTCIQSGDMSTWDSDILTKLVIGAHDLGVRVQLSNGGPRALKIFLHPREGRDGRLWQRHPTIEQAIAAWRT